MSLFRGFFLDKIPGKTKSLIAENSGTSGISVYTKWTWIEIAVIVFALILLAILPGLPGVKLCPVLVFSGHPCLTCGITRSVWSILHGNIIVAWDYNPLGFILLTVLIRRIFILLAPGSKFSALVDNPVANTSLMILFFGVGILNYFSVI